MNKAKIIHVPVNMPPKSVDELARAFVNRTRPLPAGWIERKIRK